MPLQKGASKEVIAANIARLIDEGFPRAQAVAIANDKAKKDAKKSDAIKRRINKK